MSEYLVDLLGHVAAYGIRAEEAARRLVETAVDQHAYVICQKIGVSFEFLTNVRDEVVARVCENRLGHVGQCKGRTKCGVRCKKRVLRDYCDAHEDQGRIERAKRTRLEAHATSLKPKVRRHVISHARFCEW